ncbi:hypothetical protein B7P34_24000 [Streptosporangium nondiastaticum]|uniref:Uncharacterized protein n=1 Tax=Streptosporangium nondiastaticum TaxID=35764 RepID=A0A9X7JM66_9ACTN|nr:hypothetical protein [Streptosporangium nondiastaticum]PSJ26207.1 hypothetical protein B7P34_24000 [Streptosporangium nondiastaticum]
MAVRDGDRIRVEASGSGWVDGIEGVVAGMWKGRLRVKVTKNAPPGVNAVLLEEDAVYDVCERIGVPEQMPLCSSCQGSGKIEWEDEEGWQHEAPCATCNGEGEVNH